MVNHSIKKKTIVPQEVEVFDPEGNSLGMFNEYEFLDLRVQIKENEAKGYYLMYEGQNIRIDRYGTLEDYPEGLFDFLDNCLLKLL